MTDKYLQDYKDSLQREEDLDKQLQEKEKQIIQL